MANNKPFKIKNGLQASRYIDNAVAPTTGAEGPDGIFSTTLYTGNGSTNTITNNVDLSTDGGLVWLKARSISDDHALIDTERGGLYELASNQASGQGSIGSAMTFNTDGFTLNNSTRNANGATYASWTFKKASNFFDVVTYSGNEVVGRQISHNLGVTPGCIIVKRTTSTRQWAVYHRSQGATKYGILNLTDAFATSSAHWNNTEPTSTHFTVGDSGDTNNADNDYVAYLFAHDTSNDGYIQCGSYTGNGSTQSVSLGWEPQFIIIKSATGVRNWIMFDSARGMTTGNDPYLLPNTSGDEGTTTDWLDATSTGFDLKAENIVNASGETFIYIAVRAVVPTETLDLSTGNHFNITMTEATNILFTNPPASGTSTAFSLEVNNNGSTITWPTTIKWHENTTPSAASTKEVYTFITTDGGTTYYGKKAGENIS
jgi:hypothetical protein